MANRTHFLQCYVALTDKAAFDAAFEQAELGGGWIVGISPDQAAIDYGAPLQIPSPTQFFNPPMITSGYFASSFNYPRNVASFTRKSGGWFGLPILFGDTHTYRWCFSFVYAGSDDNEGEIPTEPTPVSMGARRWVDGFEQGNAALGTNNAELRYSPESSRHIGGLGFPCRDDSLISVTHTLAETAVVDNKGWDRFYIRLRRAPLTSQDVWQYVGAISAGNNIRLNVNPSGQLEAVNVSGGGRTSIGTGVTLTIGQWYKVDLLYRTGLAADPSFFKVYVNGVSSINVSGGSLPIGTGLTQVQNIIGCTLSAGHSAAHRGEWDLDDWVSSPLPVGGANPELFPARDWNSGSKIVRIAGKAPAASNTGNWAGPGGANANDWRFTTQRPVTSGLSQSLATSSASQRFAVVSDADRRIDYDPLNRGANGIAVVSNSTRSALPADAVAGVKLPGGSEVTKVLAGEVTAGFIISVGGITHPGGSIEPVSPLATTELSYTCNSSATAHALTSLGAMVECIGVFHPEDYVPQAGDPPNMPSTGLAHWFNNAQHMRVPDSAWAQIGQPPPSLVVIHTRTYVGNSTSQQLAFRTPPSWIFIRNTATHQFCWWFCGGPGAMPGTTDASRTSIISRVFIDPNFTEAAEDQQTEQTIVEICGNGVESNLNAVTYNLIAWCDPGMRFSEVGGLVQTGASAESRDSFLNTSDFVPEFLTAVKQSTGNGSVSGLYVKGLGNNTQELMISNGAALSTGLEFITGGVRTPSGSGIYATSIIQVTFLVLRRIDDAADQDVGIEKVMQLASWTGDGTASRTISLGPASGRRPNWAMVMGSNGAGRLRDATHTSTNSLNIASASQVTDGITAGGIDSISVGSALNTNAVRFEALVFPGCDAVAVNNGWGGNCESIPVPPKSPKRPPIVPPIEIPPITPGTTPGTTPLTPTGTITQCPTESTIVINMALSRIGISKQLTSTTLNTEVSAEATVARLHYDEDVRAILRDFPWPFATRYEVLTAVAGPAIEQDTVQAFVSTTAYPRGSVVRVSGIDYYALGNAAAGTPVTNTAAWSTTPTLEVNGDWLYAYRAPTLMAMARRVVDNTEKTRRQWDTTPPDFRVGSDALGAIIYSNELNVELEYTVLDNCVARQGDALFRNALAWRHAHALAPALTRDEKITASCWSQYERLLRDARTSAAQEKQDPREGDPDWLTGRN
jgi:hypothetical protein